MKKDAKKEKGKSSEKKEMRHLEKEETRVGKGEYGKAAKKK